MDQGDVVVATYYIAERAEAFFYSLNLYCVGEGIADMLEFLVGS